MLSAQASAAAQATDSPVAWIPLLTIRAKGDVGQTFPDFPAGKTHLAPGETLQAGQSLVSPNGWFTVVVQTDGNVVLYNKGMTAIWSTRTRGNNLRLVHQLDGNVVLYDDQNHVYWQTGTGGFQTSGLHIQSDGNFALYATDGKALWHIGYGTSMEPRETILRVVSNTEDVVSRGMLFSATHFDLVLPADNGETFPTVELKIANVDGLLIQTIRGFPTAPEMTLEIVLSSSPNVVERTVDFLVLRSVEYNALTISGRLVVESSLSNRFPAYDYTPPTHPGLFA